MHSLWSDKIDLIFCFGAQFWWNRHFHDSLSHGFEVHTIACAVKNAEFGKGQRCQHIGASRTSR